MKLEYPKFKSEEDFIGSAGKPVVNAPKKKKEKFPWENDKIRDDVKKTLLLRIPEPYKKKLEYISKETKIPEHKLIMELLTPWIDKEVLRIIKNK
tara:strand:- start:142 stop:426 length:285 start_codon:yes stop_codon:yes gene_type:complete